MKKKLKKILKIAIDSPAAAGAGTLAKTISKHYNLFYLDTGKIYRYIAYIKIKNPKKFSYNLIKKKISNLKVKTLRNRKLIEDSIGTEASVISKDKKIRNLVHRFQLEFAYNPPKKFRGSCLDGRDITYKIIPDADFKFFITANVKTRAKRRYLELKKLKSNITFKEVLKSIKKRDKSDYNRKISPLTKKYSILINSENLTKKACFLKIKKIMDTKLKN